jgi:hypothetical protein
MKRRFEGLREAARSSSDELPDGLFLVWVERVQYRWHAQKPFYALRLSVLEPRDLGGRAISGQLSCTSKTLWKLSWFLRDFGYDTELFGREEIDEKALLGLRGVIKISHTTVGGTRLINLDGFAPVSQWEELAPISPAKTDGSEVG